MKNTGKKWRIVCLIFFKYCLLLSIFHLSALSLGLGFPNRVLRTRFHPQRLGHFALLSFTAYGGKIQVTRFAGGR
jgi:hypothetical protein